jgi:uncharacterized Zn finger protein
MKGYTIGHIENVKPLQLKPHHIKCHNCGYDKQISVIGGNLYNYYPRCQTCGGTHCPDCGNYSLYEVIDD